MVTTTLPLGIDKYLLRFLRITVFPPFSFLPSWCRARFTTDTDVLWQTLNWSLEMNKQVILEKKLKLFDWWDSYFWWWNIFTGLNIRIYIMILHFQTMNLCFEKFLSLWRKYIFVLWSCLKQSTKQDLLTNRLF